MAISIDSKFIKPDYHFNRTNNTNLLAKKEFYHSQTREVQGKMAVSLNEQKLQLGKPLFFEVFLPSILFHPATCFQSYIIFRKR